MDKTILLIIIIIVVLVAWMIVINQNESHLLSSARTRQYSKCRRCNKYKCDCCDDWKCNPYTPPSTPPPTPPYTPPSTPPPTPPYTPPPTPPYTPPSTPPYTPPPTPPYTPPSTPPPTPPSTPPYTPPPTPPIPPEHGCTYTQGYWKTHGPSDCGKGNNINEWPITNLILGSVMYSDIHLCQILNQPIQGNGLISLAHQLISTKLNIANGASPIPIQSIVAAADILIDSLVIPPIGFDSLPTSSVGILVDQLDQYNNGLLGVPHC